MMIRRNPDASEQAGGCAAEPVRTLKNDHAEPGLRRHQRACHSGGARAEHDPVRFHQCPLPPSLRWAHASPPTLLRIPASEVLQGYASPGRKSVILGQSWSVSLTFGCPTIYKK